MNPNFKARMIRPDGGQEFLPDDISFEQVKELLGICVAEPVYFAGQKGVCMLVDEEGLFKGSPVNHEASHLVGRPIVGNVAIVPISILD